MIEAKLSLPRLRARTTANSGRWSFYIALPFPSSTCAPGLRAHLQLRSFGLDSVRSAVDWRARAHVFESKGMVAIAVRFVACASDGL